MNPEESIIKKFHPHPFYFFSFYFSGILLFAGSIVAWVYFSKNSILLISLVGILVFFLAEISRHAETFYILDGGIAREYRLLSTSREFAEYEKIQNIKINQSFLENMFGIGNINFDTAGGDIVEVRFHGIENPYEIESLIREKMK
ncbi:MAG: PH domain-containing protein [Candidatus Paceibacterota bacterium]